jgi:hypothetical protein
MSKKHNHDDMEQSSSSSSSTSSSVMSKKRNHDQMEQSSSPTTTSGNANPLTISEITLLHRFLHDPSKPTTFNSIPRFHPLEVTPQRFKKWNQGGALSKQPCKLPSL